MFCLEKEGRGGCCRDQKELFEVIYSVKNRRRVQALKDGERFSSAKETGREAALREQKVAPEI